MKNYFVIIVSAITLLSCQSPRDKVQKAVNDYIKENAKNEKSYKSIFLSEIDTVSKYFSDSLYKALDLKYQYSVLNIYEIENSSKEKVFMSVDFHIDSNFNVISTFPKGINGDYGQLAGNVYWKYNDYVGEKPDVGSEIRLLPLDTLRKQNYSATTDVAGNFKFDKVLPGRYFLIARSKNTTNSPDRHLDRLLLYSLSFKELWGYDIIKSNEKALREYKSLDSSYNKILLGKSEDYGGLRNQINLYNNIEKKKMELAEKIIDSLPNVLSENIRLYTAYSNKLDFSNIIVEEGNTATENIDFGTTYY